jgi:hypothetical protein
MYEKDQKKPERRNPADTMVGLRKLAMGTHDV